MKTQIKISQTPISEDSKPYIIAEVGSNFDKNLGKAKKLIDLAAASGANAVKFQLFKADILYPNKDDLYEIFKSIELNAEWVPLLNKHAIAQGLHFIASAFDLTSVEILEKVNVPAHKVASSEVTNLALVHKLASTKKPIIISTGMCDMVDVQNAVNVCKGLGNNKIILLQCGALYPLPVEQVNLKVIKTLSTCFKCPVGFSDHTLGEVAATTAVGLGAKVFEKHFTLDKSSTGPDHFYALEPQELKSYVRSIHEANENLGSSEKYMLENEREIGRRDGLYINRKMLKGDALSKNDIKIMRPALGLRARYASNLLGATLNRDMKEGEPIKWEDISF